MKSVTTLVVLADDRRARFLENRGVDKGLSEVQELSTDDFEDVETEYSDRRGRDQARPGPASHALERTTSVERQQREAFARHLLEEAGKLMKKNGYDRLAIAAAPQMLGELRNGMPDDLQSKLAFDLDKDLVKVPTAKLVDHFADKIAF